MEKERLRFKVGDRFSVLNSPKRKGTVIGIELGEEGGTYFIYTQMDDAPKHKYVFFQFALRKVNIH